jgi:hypothetical protein
VQLITNFQAGQAKATEVLQALTEDLSNEAAKVSLKPAERYVALDMEWPVLKGKGKKTGKVAVIQLATHRGEIILFHIAKMGGIPASLKQLLQDARVAKIGVNTASDVAKLYRDHQVQIKGHKELGRLAKQRFFASRANVSLQDQWPPSAVPIWARTRPHAFPTGLKT